MNTEKEAKENDCTESYVISKMKNVKSIQNSKTAVMSDRLLQLLSVIRQSIPKLSSSKIDTDPDLKNVLHPKCKPYREEYNEGRMRRMLRIYKKDEEEFIKYLKYSSLKSYLAVCRRFCHVLIRNGVLEQEKIRCQSFKHLRVQMSDEKRAVFDEYRSEMKDTFYYHYIYPIALLITQQKDFLNALKPDDFNKILESYTNRRTKEHVKIMLFFFRAYLSRKFLLPKPPLPSYTPYPFLLYVHSSTIREEIKVLETKIKNLGIDERRRHQALGSLLRWMYESGLSYKDLNQETIRHHYERLTTRLTFRAAYSHAMSLVKVNEWLIQTGIKTGEKIIYVTDIIHQENKPIEDSLLLSRYFWMKICPKTAALCREVLSEESKISSILRSELYVLRWILSRIGLENPPWVKIEEVETSHIEAIVKEMRDLNFMSQTIHHAVEILRKVFDNALRKNLIQNNPVTLVKCQEIITSVVGTNNNIYETETINIDTCQTNEIMEKKDMEMSDTCIYARSSSDEKSRLQQESVPKQIATLTEWANQMKWNFHEDTIYSDKDNGWNSGRIGVQKLLLEISMGWVKRVIVYSLSRLARDKLFIKKFLEKIIKHNVELWVYDIRKRIDPKDIGDYLHTIVLSIFDDEEISSLSEKVHWGYVRKIIAGGYTSGKAPTGFKYDDKRNLIFEPEFKSIIERIFKEALERGSKSIANTLEYERKIEKILAPKPGEMWKESRVNSILRNPIYCGKIAYNKLRYKIGKAQKIPRIEWKYSPVKREEIISEELFDKVQNAINERQISTKIGIGTINIFRGILECGHHGLGLNISKTPRRERYGLKLSCPKDFCPNQKLPEEFILNIILNQIEKVIKISPKLENIQETIEKLLTQDQRNITMKINVVERQIKQLKIEQKECWKKCEDGIFNLKSGGQAFRDIENTINQLKRQLTQLNYERKNQIDNREMTSEHRTFISDFSTRLLNANREDRALLLSKAIEKIYVYERTKFKIYLNFKMSTLSNHDN